MLHLIRQYTADASTSSYDHICQWKHYFHPRSFVYGTLFGGVTPICAWKFQSLSHRQKSVIHDRYRLWTPLPYEVRQTPSLQVRKGWTEGEVRWQVLLRILAIASYWNERQISESRNPEFNELTSAATVADGAQQNSKSTNLPRKSPTPLQQKPFKRQKYSHSSSVLQPKRQRLAFHNSQQRQRLTSAASSQQGQRLGRMAQNPSQPQVDTVDHYDPVRKHGGVLSRKHQIISMRRHANICLTSEEKSVMTNVGGSTETGDLLLDATADAIAGRYGLDLGDPDAQRAYQDRIVQEALLLHDESNKLCFYCGRANHVWFRCMALAAGRPRSEVGVAAQKEFEERTGQKSRIRYGLKSVNKAHKNSLAARAMMVDVCSHIYNAGS